MSNTRRSKNPEEFNQERFCSSERFEIGLLANLVARRLQFVTNPLERELILFIQWLSHQSGGLTAFGRRIERMHPGRVLAGVEWFKTGLTSLCLDPDRDVQSSPSADAAVLEMQKQKGFTFPGFVSTTVSQKVSECLEYAWSESGLVIVEGPARIGKTYSAKQWCEQHPGRARYFQVPATNDDIGFFRAIARSLGVGCALSMKGVQMRERVEYVLQETKMMLVADESHFCWPQNNRKEALPNRINWLMTALANYKVPVCLIATPQFTADQKAVERKTGWASEQFIGRITHYERLPEGLAEAELKEIAQSLLPGVKDTRCAEALACYAQSSKRYVAGIEAAVKRARYYARKSGRETVNFKDIAEALKCSVIPSDTALHNALMDRSQRKGRRSAEPARNDSARTEPFAPAPTEEPRISF